MTVRAAPLAQAFPAARLHVGRLPLFARDFGLVVGVILGYFLLRGAAPTRVEFALTVTKHLVRIERDTRTFWEPQLQDASIRFYAVKETANFVYAYGHFPVLALVGAWLWWRARDRFFFIRNVLFISMLIGLLFYYLVPAAPPRLLAANGYDLGFTDTVFGGDTSVSYAQPSLILNEYAAIPSFHFGWIALASVAIWMNAAARWARTMAVTLTLVMTWAIVASANHLFIDMAIGGVVIGLSWQLALRLERRRRAAARRPSRAAALTPGERRRRD